MDLAIAVAVRDEQLAAASVGDPRRHVERPAVLAAMRDGRHGDPRRPISNCQRAVQRRTGGPRGAGHRRPTARRPSAGCGGPRRSRRRATSPGTTRRRRPERDRVLLAGSRPRGGPGHRCRRRSTSPDPSTRAAQEVDLHLEADVAVAGERRVSRRRRVGHRRCLLVSGIGLASGLQPSRGAISRCERLDRLVVIRRVDLRDEPARAGRLQRTDRVERSRRSSRHRPTRRDVLEDFARPRLHRRAAARTRGRRLRASGAGSPSLRPAAGSPSVAPDGVAMRAKHAVEPPNSATPSIGLQNCHRSACRATIRRPFFSPLAPTITGTCSCSGRGAWRTPLNR